MKSTIFCPPVWIAGRSRATTAAAAAARPTASTTQLTRLSPRSSRRMRSAASRSLKKSASNMQVTPFSWLDGLGEEAEEAVGEQQHEHREQRRDRRVHGEVGAVGGALEVAVLFGARLACLLAEEVEVRTLFGGEQLGEASEGRLARLAADADECLALAERALATGERERPRELLAERAGAVAGGELERLPQRLTSAEGKREDRDRLRQVEEDRLPPSLDLRAKQEVWNEEAGEPEEEQGAGRRQPAGRGRVREQRDERRRERDQQLVGEEAGERLPAARLAQVALVRGAQTGEPRRRLEDERTTGRPTRWDALGAGEAGGERRTPERIRVGEEQAASDETGARQEQDAIHGPPPVRRGSGTRPRRRMSR